MSSLILLSCNFIQKTLQIINQLKLIMICSDSLNSHGRKSYTIEHNSLNNSLARKILISVCGEGIPILPKSISNAFQISNANLQDKLSSLLYVTFITLTFHVSFAIILDYGHGYISDFIWINLAVSHSTTRQGN